ncbi:MAG: hypothetical protein AMXMBFR4_12140 [Candidatus Hydrogenedentota bacterium]
MGLNPVVMGMRISEWVDVWYSKGDVAQFHMGPKMSRLVGNCAYPGFFTPVGNEGYNFVRQILLCSDRENGLLVRKILTRLTFMLSPERFSPVAALIGSDW